jgi:hypothetical protein
MKSFWVREPASQRRPRGKDPLLGYAGFLKYFDADFHRDDPEVILKPNRSFPGVRI